MTEFNICIRHLLCANHGVKCRTDQRRKNDKIIYYLKKKKGDSVNLKNTHRHTHTRNVKAMSQVYSVLLRNIIWR